MKSHIAMLNNRKKGVTIFFAMLIIALLIGIGSSISLLSQKQVNISTLSKQSELAFYSADSGAECVFYWDKNSTKLDPWTAQSTAAINCNAASVTVCDNTTSFCTDTTKTFRISFGNNACADITLSKQQLGDAPFVVVTTLTSQGYNDCRANAVNQLQRTIKVTY